MAQRRRNGLVQGTAAQPSSIPAPVGGWNARDSIANMAVTDAVTLENWFPNVSNVVLRGGYSEHATGLIGQVETLLNYNSGSAEKIFAVVDTGKIYDVTAAGAVGPEEVSGLTNARWEYTNVTTAGGSYIYAVNGLDDALLYDGSIWTPINSLSSPAITGVTTSTLDNVCLFKSRVWFIQKNTLKAWYLPTSSVGGAAQALDMGPIATLGGHIVAVAAWTIDAGYGVDDNLVFMTSRGQVILWRGTDPASAATWAMVGVWSLGDPIGKRCIIKYGGDLLMLTQDGLYLFAQYLQSSRIQPQVALSDKIQGAFASAANSYGSLFGWQIVVIPKYNAAFVNVPFSVGAQQQFVMNNITKAWCNFTGWHANCWEHYADNPYFGGNGFVGRAWDESFADNDTDIATNAIQAFNYFGSRGVQKYFTRARPSLFTNGTPAIFVGVNVDFDLSDTTSALTFSANPTGRWDVGLWDQALWGSSLVITNNWQGITGLGYCAGVHLKSASQGLQIEWASTDVVYQNGWAGV